jgi:hypothetical protein
MENGGPRSDHKTANSSTRLIRASLKRSESYASELEEETFAELIKNGGPKAKKMLKLIKEGGRISDKIKSCFR